MISLHFPKKVKFLVGFIYSDEEVYLRAKNILRKKYGEFDFESQTIPFDFTDYYCEEMGTHLKRRFLSARKLFKLTDFVAIKHYCIKIEKMFSCSGMRKINIDPGYLNDAKLVLLTRKNFFHRIYLGKGIYAEVTLYYSKKKINYLPWTYPDYRTEEYTDIILKIRNTYMSQIRHAYPQEKNRAN